MGESDGVLALNKMSREELYDAVWSEAMATLAPKLGISDVGLKKRCNNLGIPTPTRGYWAKLQNGKKVKKEPLPASWSIVRMKKIPKSADDLKKYTPPERDYSLEKLPPIVAATKKALLKQKPNFDYGLSDVWQQGVLRTKVAPPNIDGAIWLFYRATRMKWEAEVNEKKIELAAIDRVESASIEQTMRLFELASTAHLRFKNADSNQKHELVGYMCSNSVWKDENSKWSFTSSLI